MYLLIHLSDLHIRDDSATGNPALQRAEQTIAAVAGFARSNDERPSTCFLVLSGDVAFSGTKPQYESGKEFVLQLLSALETTFPGVTLHVLIVPGNHDCNFDMSTAARSVLLQAAEIGTIDHSIVEQGVVVQSEFTAFQTDAEFHSGPVDCEDLLALRRCKVETEEGVVTFHLLNTAWMSSIKEVPGSLLFPLDKSHFAKCDTAGLSIAIMHHPYNWLRPDNARELRKVLENACDLILTGHEHDPISHTAVTQHTATEYFEGGVLQETGNPDASSFIAMLINLTEGREEVAFSQFSWEPSGSRYVTVGNGTSQFLRKSSRLRNRFALLPHFASTMDDPGAGFSHPRKEHLTFSDLYMYPDFANQGAYDRGPANQEIVRRDHYARFLCEPRIFVSGEEQSGKTALSKKLVIDLRRGGRVPILATGQDFAKFMDSVSACVRKVFERQYAPSEFEPFVQLPKSQRAIIIDDFHKIALNRSGKERLLQKLTEMFANVIILSREDLVLDDLAHPEVETPLLWGLTRWKILEFGRVLRGRLLTQWIRIGQEYTTEHPEISRAASMLESATNQLLSHSLIPAYPIFILVIIQTLEAKVLLQTGAGMYGHLYQVLITNALSYASASSLETRHSYLSSLAWMFYRKRLGMVTRADAVDHYHGFCDFYRLPKTGKSLLDELIAANVLLDLNGEIRFRYKYYYCFFVARYIGKNLPDAEVRATLVAMSEKLHVQDIATIVLFVCHFASEDEFVTRTLLEASRRLFAKHEEADFDKDSRFLNDLISQLPPLRLLDGTPEENREALRENEDETNGIGTRESAEVSGEDDQEPEGAQQFFQLNAAFKTIQILGQILRAFPASIQGDRKREIMAECYGLGLRTTRFFLDFFSESRDEVSRALLEIARERRPGLEAREYDVIIRNAIFALNSGLAFAIVRHVSHSVGLEILERTFDEVLEIKNTVASQTIDLAVRLEYFRSFPEKSIGTLWKRCHGNNFGRSVVQTVVWDHLCLSDVDYRVRQRACQLVDISDKKSRLLIDPRRKK